MLFTHGNVHFRLQYEPFGHNWLLITSTPTSAHNVNEVLVGQKNPAFVHDEQI